MMKTMKNQSKKIYRSPRTRMIMAEGSCLLSASSEETHGLNTSGSGVGAGSSAANTFSFGFME